MKSKVTLRTIVIAFAFIVSGFLFDIGPSEVNAAETVVSTWDELHTAMANGGNIKLGADIDITDADPNAVEVLVVPEKKTVTLDLNGKHINRGRGKSFEYTQYNYQNGFYHSHDNGGVIKVYGTLTIKNTGDEENGYLGDGNATEGSGVAVYGGTLNLVSGKIKDSYAKSGNGSGVYIGSNGNKHGVFNMSGGSIENNWTDSISGHILTYGVGAGVYIGDGCTFNITAGTITSNRTYGNSKGAAVFCDVGGKFNVSGKPVIKRNYKSSSSFEDIYIAEERAINIVGKLEEGAELHVVNRLINENKEEYVSTVITNGYRKYNSEPIDTFFKCTEYWTYILRETPDGEVEIYDHKHSYNETMLYDENNDPYAVEIKCSNEHNPCGDPGFLVKLLVNDFEYGSTPEYVAKVEGEEQYENLGRTVTTITFYKEDNQVTYDYVINHVGDYTAQATLINLSAKRFTLIQPFKVTKKKLTITVPAKSITYGDKAPTLTLADLKYDGFAEGDDYSVLKGNLVISCDYNQYDDAVKPEGGNYYIKASGLTSDNYDITFKKGKLTVKPRELNFSWQDEKEFIYDGTEKSVAASISNAVNDDELEIIYNDNKKVTAGLYTAMVIGVEGAKAPNYKLPSKTPACRWAIEKNMNDNIVTVNAKDITYGDKCLPPEVTADFGVETAEIFYSDKEDGDFTGDVPVNAGTYYVKAVVAETENYRQGESPAVTFSINPAKLTVKANDKTIYNDEDATNAGVTFTGFVNDESEDTSDLTGTLEYTYGGYEKGKEPGTYPITVSGLTSNNYAIEYMTGNLIVKAAAEKPEEKPEDKPDIIDGSDDKTDPTDKKDGAETKDPVSQSDTMISELTTDDDTEDSVFFLLQAKAKPLSKTSLKLSWKKVKGAKQYIIYGNKCGRKNRYNKITTVSAKKTSYVAKKLKKGTYYKFIVVAVGEDKILSTSKTIHCVTNGGKKGNNTKIVLNKKKLTLKVGKSKKIKAKLKSKKKVSIHRKVAWESDNPDVAKVNSKGKITAIGKGTCYVYAYAQNGVAAKIKVKVK